MRPARFVSLVLALGGLALAPGCDSGRWQDVSRSSAAASSPPSIVLVSIDTTRADRLGCYGYHLAATPNIDRWASEGVLFENAATPTPVTLPAHASLLTGLLPNRHGVRDNGVYRLEPDVVTLAETLFRDGYDTAAVVGAAVLDREYGLARGFRLYDDRVQPAGLIAIQERDARQVTDAALTAVAGLKRPFFLFVHYFDPHAAYDPPSPYRESFRDRPYDGEIAFVDHEMGRLRAGLESAGVLADGIVTLVSDHGEGLGEHGEASHGVFLYQSTVHVPWILSAPGRLPAGHRASGFARLTDLMPTLLDLAGLVVPEGLDGRSLHGTLVADERAAPEPAWLLLETEFGYNSYGWAPLHGLTDGSWKWIDAPRPELYDLRSDPRERTDLHSADAVETARLAQRWHELFTIDRRTTPAPREPPAERAERLARLESLGYVSAARGFPTTDRSLPDPKDVIGTLDRINEARRLLSAGALPSAERILESILADAPGNLSALIILGAARIEAGRAADAVVPLERAAALAPHNADTHFNLGLARLAAGDDDGAVRAWRNTLAVSPRHEAAAVNLIDLLMQEGRPGDARTLLDDVRRKGQRGPILDYLDGKLALFGGDRAAARTAFDRALGGPLPPHIARDARALLRLAESGR